MAFILKAYRFCFSLPISQKFMKKSWNFVYVEATYWRTSFILTNFLTDFSKITSFKLINATGNRIFKRFVMKMNCLTLVFCLKMPSNLYNRDHFKKKLPHFPHDYILQNVASIHINWYLQLKMTCGLLLLCCEWTSRKSLLLCWWLPVAHLSIV